MPSSLPNIGQNRQGCRSTIPGAMADALVGTPLAELPGHGRLHLRPSRQPSPPGEAEPHSCTIARARPATAALGPPGAGCVLYRTGCAEQCGSRHGGGCSKHPCRTAHATSYWQRPAR